MINKPRYRILLYTAVAVASMVILSCATVVKPNGGPKDSTAPALEIAYPADSTVNFTESKIILEFNEFVKLNNCRAQLLMNPIIVEDVEISARGKKVIIKLPDSLDDAGTYHIFFGNSVQDITEGNITTNLHYVFSTGHYLDSCSISGYAINAFENTSNKEAWLLLHKQYADIQDTTPVYLAHADEKGAFQFSNLKPGTYYAFALVDANSDYKFSLANELVGFYPDPIVLSPEISRIDSIKIRLFENADTIQKKIKSEIFRFRTVRVGFKQEMANPKIQFLKGSGSIYEWDENNDTVLLWVGDRNTDSLNFIIRDVTYSETILQAINVKLRSNKALTDTTVKVFSNIQKGKLMHFDTLKLNFFVPLTNIDDTKMLLISGADTVGFSLEKYDSLGREWSVIFEVVPELSGTLICDSGAFTNLFGHTNDSTAIKWQTTKDEDFGDLILSLGLPPSYPFIVQLSGSEGYEEQYLPAWTDTIKFSRLLPGSYEVKIIVDKNKDGKFTTGDYESQRQPEPVYTLPRPIAIRQNFESRSLWTF